MYPAEGRRGTRGPISPNPQMAAMTEFLETVFAQAAEAALRDLVKDSAQPLQHLSAAAGELFHALHDAAQAARDVHGGTIADMLKVFEAAVARVWAELGGHPDHLPRIEIDPGAATSGAPQTH